MTVLCPTGRRVLLVEDEMLVCMLLEDMLADLGCEVVGPATRLDDALALIAGERLDAAVLDVNLDGEPSYPAADALAARGVPFLFTTGYGRLKDGYGRMPRLQKPFDPADLEAALSALFAGGAG